jgi:hypothetical protein
LSTFSALLSTFHGTSLKKSRVGFYTIVHDLYSEASPPSECEAGFQPNSLYASLELQATPCASKRSGAIPLGRTFTNAPPLKCSVHGSSPMHSPKALCSVLSNASYLIPSTGVVYFVKSGAWRTSQRKAPSCDFTSFGVLGTDCRHREHFEALVWYFYRPLFRGPPPPDPVWRRLPPSL